MSPDVRELAAFVLAVALVAGAIAVPASAAVSTAGPPPVSQTTATSTANDSGNGTIAPGQRLAGVVGVQDAELDSELQERTLSTRVSRAGSNDSKAAVVATDVNRIRDQLQHLRARQEALREARQAGELSTGEYTARMAITSARIRALQTRIQSNERVSRDLPDAALESKGVDREELDRLKADAAELQGPEVAALARRIAGEDPGRELDPERGPGELPEPARGDDDSNERTPDDGGPPANGADDATNRSTGTGPSGTDAPEDPGQSGDAGSDGASGDDSGQSGDAGSDGASGDDSGKSNDASGDDPGQSGDAGSDGASGDDSGQSDDAGDGASGDDSGQSDDAGSDGARGGDGGPDDQGESGENGNPPDDTGADDTGGGN